MFVSILIGLGVGVLFPLIAHAVGMPRGMVAPVMGALIGSLIPLSYRLQTRKDSSERR
jgi:predicted membrane-bound spermidine synthase